MNICCVPECKNVFKAGSTKKYHSFPQDSAVRLEWIRAIKTHREPSKNWLICSAHFKFSDYTSDGQLRKKSIPSLCLPSEVKKLSSKKRRGRTQNTATETNAKRVAGTIKVENELIPSSAGNYTCTSFIKPEDPLSSPTDTHMGTSFIKLEDPLASPTDTHMGTSFIKLEDPLASPTDTHMDTSFIKLEDPLASPTDTHMDTSFIKLEDPFSSPTGTHMDTSFIKLEDPLSSPTETHMDLDTSFVKREVDDNFQETSTPDFHFSECKRETAKSEVATNTTEPNNQSLGVQTSFINLRVNYEFISDTELAYGTGYKRRIFIIISNVLEKHFTPRNSNKLCIVKDSLLLTLFMIRHNTDLQLAEIAFGVSRNIICEIVADTMETLQCLLQRQDVWDKSFLESREYRRLVGSIKRYQQSPRNFSRQQS
ncbi:hypothetical protein Bhyg_06449, partial [Pseudolycoriella hygida]